MANVIDIVIPDLGEFSDVEVIEILVKPGDEVAGEDGLITLETDKAVMDVPAAGNGVIEEISVAVGDKVSAGDVIGRLTVEISDTVVATPASEARLMQGETTVVAPPPVQAPAAPAAASPPKPHPDLPAIDEAGFSKAHAGPSVRKLARELGVTWYRSKGRGRRSGSCMMTSKHLLKRF